MNRYRRHHLAAWFVIAAQFTSPAWAAAPRVWSVKALNAQYTTMEKVSATGDAVEGMYMTQDFEFGVSSKGGKFTRENGGKIAIAGIGKDAQWSVTVDAPAAGWAVSPNKKADHVGHLVIGTGKESKIRAISNKVVIVKASTTVDY